MNCNDLSNKKEIIVQELKKDTSIRENEELTENSQLEHKRPRKERNNYNGLQFGKRGNFFICPYENCGKEFGEKGNLVIHIRIHVRKIFIF